MDIGRKRFNGSDARRDRPDQRVHPVRRMKCDR